MRNAAPANDRGENAPPLHSTRPSLRHIIGGVGVLVRCWLVLLILTVSAGLARIGAAAETTGGTMVAAAGDSMPDRGGCAGGAVDDAGCFHNCHAAAIAAPSSAVGRPAPIEARQDPAPPSGLFGYASPPDPYPPRAVGSI